jgi:hypothetical protein
MGNSVTVDSETSAIEDIIELDDNMLDNVHVKKEVPDIVNYHLKVFDN